MLRFLLSIIVILGVAGASPNVFASTSGGDNATEHKAFEFASSKDWDSALKQAEKSSDPVLLKLITWEYILDTDSGASFDEITSFIDENPNWPEQKKLHLRAEMSLRDITVKDKAIIKWFGDETPVSGIGKIALAEAMTRAKIGRAERTESLIRDAWRGGDFDEPEEKKILETYSSILNKEDHIARISRLLWEDRIIAAKRILKHAPDNYQKLFKARIALQENKSLAVLAVAQVPSALKNDPGLIYDRIAFRMLRDDDNGVRDMLLAAPENPPYPDKWWKYREYEIRTAIDEKKYALARKLLNNHGQVDGSGFADAIWLRGWLKTEFMGEAKSGLADFSTMYDNVHYPVSKARAAYWAGRAAEKSGDVQAAKQWYDTAAVFPTTFYGQLGELKSNASNPKLHIPKPPQISDEARSSFNNNEVVKAIKLCIDMGELDFASHLISMLIENSEDEAQIAMLSELGIKAGHVHLSVHAAKKALQQNVVLVESGYPTPKTPENLPIERPLALAIVRQESEFNPKAVSPSGAVGLMQMLAGTAKEIAKKLDMKFSKDRLENSEYNITLGSMYISRLVNSYDGSYIMAIAAYNAGPGNVHNWVQLFGTPNKNNTNNSIDGAVNWIEKIPFHETRNYVQRVMENLQVFRSLDNKNSSSKLKLAEDLTH